MSKKPELSCAPGESVDASKHANGSVNLLPQARRSQKVERGTPLYEQIQEALWDKILSGDIVPGQHLSDRQWAENLNVSRTPVREAMRQMARDGLLITLDNGGYQVRPVDRAGLLDLYVCRSVLAGAAARETARRGDKRLVGKLKEAIRRKDAALAQRDGQEVLKQSSIFHDLIVNGSKNEFLINTMNSIKKLILYYRVTLLKSSQNTNDAMNMYFKHLEAAQDRHKGIVTAIEMQNDRLAFALMEDHLVITSRDMDQLFSSS